MALNSITAAEKFTGELDKMIAQKAVTGLFSDNALRAKFVGADVVKIPDIDFVGLADYDRDGGFAKAKTTITQTAYQLTKDRARQLQIDREDMDETGVANLAGRVLGEYIRTKVVPEVDAYVLSKLYHIADDGDHVKPYAAATAVSDLLDIINDIQNAAGYDEELVAFVNPVLYAALMTASEMNFTTVASDFKAGEVNRQVRLLNGVPIIPVSAERMKSKYEFDAGAEATAGGFSAAADAKDVYAVILPKNACSLIKKTEVLRTFTPDQNVDRDAYIFNYRLVYDAFVKKSNLGTVYAIAGE